MYLCVRRIDYASFYNFSIGLCKCSNSGFFFHFLFVYSLNAVCRCCGWNDPEADPDMSIRGRGNVFFSQKIPRRNSKRKLQ